MVASSGKDRNAIDQITVGLKVRVEPIVIFLATASFRIVINIVTCGQNQPNIMLLKRLVHSFGHFALTDVVV